MTDDHNEVQDNAAGRPVATDPRTDALIGNKLRAYFDKLLEEPVPDRILELLEQLAAKENQGKPGSEP